VETSDFVSFASLSCVEKSIVAFWSFLENPVPATLSVLLSKFFSVVLITKIRWSSTLSLPVTFPLTQKSARPSGSIRLTGLFELLCQRIDRQEPSGCRVISPRYEIIPIQSVHHIQFLAAKLEGLLFPWALMAKATTGALK
jgi:hypothetical protein